MARPWYVEALEKGDPDCLEQMQSLQAFACADGALPARIKTLMMLMGDAMLAHGEGVKALAARARAQGAGEDEIAETVRMAFVMGGLPALVTGTNAFQS
ncbi:MAG: carboxymuconolactone decarboxylase family protein [Planctomycetes bacterium]|nr:carboxymuconolactone decarboxylase family protein [Planctomycetota bacterium]